MATTKLILTHDVPNLGHAGEVVEVKAGYARNYLVPRGFAAKWTAGAQKQIDQIAAARRRHEIATIDDARVVRDTLQDLRQGWQLRPPVRRRLRCCDR